MKLFTLALALVLTIFSAQITAEPAKYLQYRYNDKVIITISNVPCILVGIKDQYNWAARADRVDGEKRIGCFKKLNEDMIRIQWYKGDFSDLPANAFLQPKALVPIPAPTL